MNFSFAPSSDSSSSSTDFGSIFNNLNLKPKKKNEKKSVSAAHGASNNDSLSDDASSSFFSSLPTLAPPAASSSASSSASAKRRSFHLSFNPVVLSASPRTMKLANLWPEKDENMQKLLITIMEIAGEQKPNDLILTTPAVISLAGCALRMGASLLKHCMESNTPVIQVNCQPLSLVPVFEDIVKTTQEKFEKGGWAAAAAPMPRCIIESWCHETKKQFAPSSQPLAALESEIQQAVLAAIVVEWVRLVLKSLHRTASRFESRFLSSMMLLEATPEASFASDFLEGGATTTLFDRIGCSAFVDFDSLQFQLTPFQGTGSVCNHFSFESMQISSGRRIVTDSADLRHRVAFSESEAACLILERGEAWFHFPTLLQRVAQQLVSGERSSHVSDKPLYEMDFRFRKLKGKQLISLEIPTYGYSPTQWVQLDFDVIDASGHRRALSMEIDQTRCGKLMDLSQPIEDNIVARLAPSNGRIEVSAFLEHSRLFQEFMPHLSNLKQQALEKLKQAVSLHGEAHKLNSEDAMNTPSNVRQLLGNPTNLEALTGPTPSTRLLTWWDPIMFIMIEWRRCAVEQILAVAIEFLDYDRWGPQRYDATHTHMARRQFQSFLLDASFQAIQMQLLPTVILDLIADYSTIEALPYVTCEEQAAMLQQAQDLSDDKLTAILESM